MNENVLFHLQIPRTVKAKYAILPGDPARVSKIASYLEDAIISFQTENILLILALFVVKMFW